MRFSYVTLLVADQLSLASGYQCAFVVWRKSAVAKAAEVTAALAKLFAAIEAPSSDEIGAVTHVRKLSDDALVFHGDFHARSAPSMQWNC